MNELSLRLLQAFIAIVFIVLVDFIFELLISRNIKEKRKSLKLRVLLRYVLFFCLVFFMAKIWVEGFGYLLTVVGIIAAALTITQKEYLMNFFGWLIIMWRELFAEGDYVEIGKYRGYVKNIGLLYFSLEESSELIWGDKTGKILKIPNSFIAVNPVVSYDSYKSFIEGRLIYTFTFESPLKKIQDLTVIMEKEIDKILNGRKSHWTPRQLTEFESLKNQSMHKARISIKVFQEKPSGMQLQIKYLSIRNDQKYIEGKIFELIMETVRTNPDVAFAEIL